MKRSIKILSLMLACSALFLLASCGGKKGESKSIYEQGLTLVSLLQEMAGSDSYLQLYSSMLEAQQILSDAANGDYTAPRAVYRIRISDAAVFAGIETLPDTLRDYASSRIQSSLANLINAQSGSSILAAASICTAEKTFVCSDFTGNTTYLYTYDSGVPVLVTFLAGEDGAVAAHGSFVLSEDFGTESAADIRQSLETFGIAAEVEEIER